MEKENYSLRWNDYDETMRCEFRDLRKNGNYSDVLIHCDDGTVFHCHRIILAISSQFFQVILKEEKCSDCESTSLIMSEMRSSDMCSILNFIYNGEVQVAEEDLSEFFKAAQTLCIKGLTDLNQRGVDEVKGAGDEPVESQSILVKALLKNSQEVGDKGGVVDIEEEDIGEMSMDEDSSDYKLYNDVTIPTFPFQHYQQQQSKFNFGRTSPTQTQLENSRVRATDPRPCPKCGKIYRSAHTLRTHLEDKHTVCPGYRCVLCGTVAKSRNSLHSHMSRQHRGISTKDLPVLPMPASFDPGLAARLLQGGSSAVNGMEHCGNVGGNGGQGEMQGSGGGNGSGGEEKGKPTRRSRSSSSTESAEKSSTGSAILDTYLQFIAENSFNLAAAAAAAAAASSGAPITSAAPPITAPTHSSNYQEKVDDE